MSPLDGEHLRSFSQRLVQSGWAAQVTSTHSLPHAQSVEGAGGDLISSGCSLGMRPSGDTLDVSAEGSSFLKLAAAASSMPCRRQAGGAGSQRRRRRLASILWPMLAAYS